jgi:CheY-like chemotaxis protein
MAGESNKSTVLVVDDTAANIELLHAILHDNYKIKVATNGAKALHLAARDPQPDIILLDIMMPGMDGYEVCRRLKDDHQTSSIPVVFITAKSQIEDEQRGLDLGAVDYITKPFDAAIVETRVRQHLTNYLQSRELARENLELRSNASRRFGDHTEESVSALIAAGENDSVEFKSTLRWNMYADKSDKRIENACLKTVAGYLNADGGFLIIGVTDDGELIGLGNDHFETEDKFLLHWVNLVKGYLGAASIPYLRSMCYEVTGQRLLVVECLPSPTPVFFRRDNDEAFFVRMTNTTQALKPSEILAYIAQRFTS